MVRSIRIKTRNILALETGRSMSLFLQGNPRRRRSLQLPSYQSLTDWCGCVPPMKTGRGAPRPGGSERMLAKGDPHAWPARHGRLGIGGVLKAARFFRVPRNNATIRYSAFLPLGRASGTPLCMLVRKCHAGQEIEHRRPGRAPVIESGWGELPRHPPPKRFRQGTQKAACRRVASHF